MVPRCQVKVGSPPGLFVPLPTPSSPSLSPAQLDPASPYRLFSPCLTSRATVAPPGFAGFALVAPAEVKSTSRILSVRVTAFNTGWFLKAPSPPLFALGSQIILCDEDKFST